MERQYYGLRQATSAGRHFRNPAALLSAKLSVAFQSTGSTASGIPHHAGHHYRRWRGHHHDQLGTGARKAVEPDFAARSPVVVIPPGQMFTRGASDVRVSLTTDDAEALEKYATKLDAVVPELNSSLTVKYGNKNLNLSITGTTANYAKVHNYTIPFGQMFTEGDDQARQRYAVLGADVPDELGVNPAAILHQTVLIRGIPFEVIGVLSRKVSSSGSF
jgi:ABC-type antimicrobial peptide transport system permease subunit